MDECRADPQSTTRADAPPAPAPALVRVGDCVVQMEENRIVRDGVEYRLAPKAMAVLRMLMAQPQRVVRREQLLDAVWAGADVGEEVLTQSIAELRRALGEHARDGALVETIRKVGYRLRVPVEPVDERVAADPSRAVVPDDTDPRAPVEPQGPITGPATDSGPRVQTSEAQARRRWLGIAAALVVAAGLWPLFRGHDDTPSTGQPWTPPRPLTTELGSEYAPAVSPDGSTVAYLSARLESGRLELGLMLRAIDSPNAQPIAVRDPAAGAPRQPAWSADGRRIAFERISGSTCRIVAVDAIGSEGSEQVLGECDALSDQMTALAWSPDGGTIAFSRRLDPHDAASPTRIHLLAVDGGAVRALAYDAGPGDSFFPHYSPDGRWLAFQHGVPGRHAPWLVPASGGEARALVPPRESMRGLDWLPDGDSLLVSLDRGLWQVRLDGSSVHLPAFGVAIQPSLARTREVLVYATTPWASANLERHDIGVTDGSGGYRMARLGAVLHPSTQDSGRPRHAPDGHSLAFVSDRSGSDQLWVADAQSGTPRPLTNLQGGERVLDYAWLRDSRTLVLAVREASGSGALLRVDRGGAPVGVIARTPGVIDAVAAGSDGESLWYAGGDPVGTLHRLRLDGGEPLALPLSGLNRMLEPGDGYLYYARNGDLGLWRARVDGTGAERLGGVARPTDRAGWTLHGADVVHWAVVPTGEALMRIPRAGALVPDLFAGIVGMFAERDFDIGPDGDHVVMVSNGAREIDLRVSERAR